jgi:hypothetical protein
MSVCKWDGPAVLLPQPAIEAGKGTKDKEHTMSGKFDSTIAVICIDIGKKHIIGQERARRRGSCSI